MWGVLDSRTGGLLRGGLLRGGACRGPPPQQLVEIIRQLEFSFKTELLRGGLILHRLFTMGRKAEETPGEMNPHGPFILLLDASTPRDTKDRTSPKCIEVMRRIQWWPLLLLGLSWRWGLAAQQDCCPSVCLKLSVPLWMVVVPCWIKMG